MLCVALFGRLLPVFLFVCVVHCAHELTVVVSLECNEDEPAENVVGILYDDDSHRLKDGGEKFFGFYARDNENKPQETRQQMDCKKSNEDGEISLTGQAEDFNRATYDSFNPVDPLLHLFVTSKTCSCPAFNHMNDDQVLILMFFFNDLPPKEPAGLKYGVIDKSDDPLTLCQWWKRQGKGKHNPQGTGEFNPWSFKNKSQLCTEKTLCGYREKYRSCFLIEDHPIYPTFTNISSSNSPYVKSGPKPYPVTEYRLTKEEYPTGEGEKGSSGNISSNWIAIVSVLGVIGFIGVVYLIYYEVKVINDRKHSSRNTAKKKKAMLDEEKRKNMEKNINKLIEESIKEESLTKSSADLTGDPKSQTQTQMQGEQNQQNQPQTQAQVPIQGQILPQVQVEIAPQTQTQTQGTK